MAFTLACLAGATHAPVSARTTHLPSPLVYLRDVDPSILQEMRYATENNFTGRVVPGYRAGECILLRPVAVALAKVQADLRRKGLSLKVYDCLRPVRAVHAFVTWGEMQAAGKNVPRFHPRTPKDRVVSLGYIAAYSAHSRGVAVDLTIVPLPAAHSRPFDPQTRYGACNGPKAARAPDNSIDMGTSFDCFDVMSFTHSREITPQQKHWRQVLLAAMHAQGFHNYWREWWHFTLAVPGANRSYDFPITQAGVAAAKSAASK
jgi:zinc D-Ala-D-Ala dipeptidase